ncbi:MAG: hypothetical protein LBN21_08165 [Treponema sp.]|jgi:hypothetical protein|nr:hypothetical protein [Treponema sp.]
MALLGIVSCGARREDNPIIPPATPPLSRSVIGYAVINVSYTHLVEAPGLLETSLGYLRRGALVTVIERRQIKSLTTFESWVLVQELPPGQYRGWLPERVVDIYDTESRAKTAADKIMKQ